MLHFVIKGSLTDKSELFISVILTSEKNVRRFPFEMA